MPETLIPNIVDFIASVDPFDKLSSDLQRQIASIISIQYFVQGEDIVSESDGEQLYIIRSGIVEQRNPNGSLKARLGSEDMFGFSLLSVGQSQAESDAPHSDLTSVEKAAPYSIKVIDEALIYCVPVQALNTLLHDKPEALGHFAINAQTRMRNGYDVVWSSNEKGLFFRPITEVLNTRIVSVESDASIQDVARDMRKHSDSSCAFIMEAGHFVGLLTDKDFTKRVVAEGIDIQQPVKSVMTREPYSVNHDDLVLQAAILMMTHGIKNIPVLENGCPVGLITPSELVQNHRVQAIFLIDKINKIERLEQLAELTAERQVIFETLVEAGVKPQVIGQVMAMIMDAYNRRLIVLAEQYLGKAPCDYAWIVAGSHARNEVHMLSDQDSALILADDASDADRAYFSHFAMYVCKGMALCGYELCSGRFMAATAQWCQPLSTWKSYYQKWANNPEYDKLLNISVFLDTRCLAGNQQLTLELQQFVQQNIHNNRRLISGLLRATLVNKPPLSIFKNIVLVKEGENANTLNIKKSAIGILVDLIRINYLHSQFNAMKALGDKGEADHEPTLLLTNTEERLQFLLEHGVMNEASHKDLLDSLHFCNQIRYAHQVKALKLGQTPNNQINPVQFNSFERKHLRESFKFVANYQDMAQMKFG